MTSFGASLRRERELRGVSLQEIAASTKIGVSMLKAIEEDRFDKLPQGLFVRGFVREYARFLALDEQKILTELSFHASQAPVVETVSREPGSRISSRLAARLVNGGLFAFVFGLVVILILSPRFSARTPAAPPVPAVDAPISAAPPSASAAAPSEMQGTQVASNGASVLPGAPGNTPPSVLPQPLQLTLTATEDCWIGLDVGGDRVENRVLKKGESFSIVARQNASLAVGNAGGLLVAIDSGPARPLGNRGEVKRNILLSPEAIGALSAGSQNVPTKPIG
ncbi:MAG: helix-turn-helix domain-containing protein [Vicinamibacteria bacterium]|nr:helix-turn-helix domain-containing protein [Vicinamibacteria bacterium]